MDSYSCKERLFINYSKSICQLKRFNYIWSSNLYLLVYFEWELGVLIANVSNKQHLRVQVFDGAYRAQRKVDLVGKIENGPRANASDRYDKLFSFGADYELVVVVLVFLRQELNFVNDRQTGAHFLMRVRRGYNFKIRCIHLSYFDKSWHLSNRSIISIQVPNPNERNKKKQ